MISGSTSVVLHTVVGFVAEKGAMTMRSGLSQEFLSASCIRHLIAYCSKVPFPDPRRRIYRSSADPSKGRGRNLHVRTPRPPMTHVIIFLRARAGNPPPKCYPCTVAGEFHT